VLGVRRMTVRSVERIRAEASLAEEVNEEWSNWRYTAQDENDPDLSVCPND
jgi:hypothetical protein